MTSHDERRAKLLEAVRSQPSATRTDVERRDLGTLAVAALVTMIVFVAIGGFHASVRPRSLVFVTSAAWAAVALLATRFALRRGRSMLGVAREWLLWGALAVVPALTLTWFALLWPEGGVSVAHGYGVDATCFVATIALAAAPLLAFVALRREGDPVNPTVTGAAIGAAAGAGGCTLIDLHCERIDARHVALGHLLPVALMIVLGALTARVLLAVRAPSS
jgi:hypothetical protein